ncbi:nucleoside phosphorylase domain-containing protein [Gigaspora rosea]|uniref:S-methyl-5'-thioadenosine phosphorylase n=1 Tax=Gigaspora rosea TaxID=44941 RepID=A0A397U3P2_9GLOM|nr:nucleoside phosphorylase domain-containing protein [Gigaspora rosea]
MDLMDKTKSVKIAVIGGSGLYNFDHLTPIKEIYPETPWGYPSSKIIIVEDSRGSQIAFLSRHGAGHQYNPSEVPSRANIAALKHIGVEVIIAFSAVGSLREEIKHQDFVLPDQIVDRTKGIRPSTYFEGGVVAHTTFADPFNPLLAEIIYSHRHCLGANVTLHRNKTVVCIEGPAFSTRAESHLYRSWGCDIINMSALPEAKLANEAEIAYQMICMSTDYDCWKQDEVSVTVEVVISNLNKNAENAKKLLGEILPDLEKAVEEGKFEEIKGVMKASCITRKDARNEEVIKKLEYILPGYFN